MSLFTSGKFYGQQSNHEHEDEKKDMGGRVHVFCSLASAKREADGAV